MPSERRRQSETPRLNVAEDRTERPPQISKETIRNRAYEIYEARAGEQGSADDDWLEAERELCGDDE